MKSLFLFPALPALPPLHGVLQAHIARALDDRLLLAPIELGYIALHAEYLVR